MNEINTSKTLDNLMKKYYSDKIKEDAFYQSSSISDIIDAELFKDCRKSLNRIRFALNNNQKILVYGHDDADGLTSAFILNDCLNKISKQVLAFIPNRNVENHGIRSTAINFAKEEKIDLFISVDNGISSHEGVELLNQAGIDTIIIDHHLVPDTLPTAYSIINPKRTDCKYPFNMLAGVGVVWLFVRTLCREFNIEYDSNWQFWAAIGTLADRVPLIGFNRIIIRDLLQNWEKCTTADNITFLTNKKEPLITFQNKMEFLEETAMLFVFGRDVLGKHKGYSYLTAVSETRESIFAELMLLQAENKQLTTDNEKAIKENVTDILFDYQLVEGMNLINNNLYVYQKQGLIQSLVYIDYKNELSYSLIGRLASQLSSLYKIPAIVIFQKDKDYVLGEARCLEGFHWLNCFNSISDCFINFGGHVKAAGFNMEYEKIEEFIAKYTSYLESINLKTSNSLYEYDLETDYQEGDFVCLMDYQKFLLPFGESNKSPVIKLNNYQTEASDIRYFDHKDKRVKKVFSSLNKTFDMVLTYMHNSEQLRLMSYYERNGE